MKTKCPHCGEEYEVESDDLGRTDECSTCGFGCNVMNSAVFAFKSY